MRAVFGLLVWTILFLGCVGPAPLLLTACFENGACIELEVADSVQERQAGLMNRLDLPANAGMLFVFESPGKHAFWMKSTLIPLDMIWLDENGKIVEIVENAAPCQADPCPTYGGQKDAKFVVEINSGFVNQNGIRLNQKVEIDRVP